MWFRRRPDEQVTVEAGASDTAAEAMLKMLQFNLLVRRFDLDLISHEGKNMTLRGRPKKVEGFMHHYTFLRSINAI